MIIEEIVRNHLDGKLSEPVRTERMENSTSNYVMIEKTGGGESNHIGSTRIAVQSYAATMYQAAELNERVKEAMKSIIERNDVSGVRLETDYNFTDTSRSEYRYQAVFLLYHY